MIPKKILAFYGFFAFPLAAAFIALQVLIPTYYAETTTLTLSAIGGIILFARLWDTFTDPLIGFLSDNTPDKFGKRKLWIFLSVPLITISTYKLFNPPSDVGGSYLLLWTFAIYLFGTMAIVPLNAWGAELSNDYNERNRITGTRAFFGLLGTLSALLLSAIYTINAENGLSDLGLKESLFAISILVILSLVIAALLIYFVPDKEKIALPKNQIKAIYSLIITPSPFRTLLISFLCNSIANAIPATLFLFYISHVLNAESYAGGILFLYFIFSIVSIPFWVKISSHFGKHKTWATSIIIACCFFILTPFLNANLLWAYIVVVLFTGFTTGCDLVIPSSMNGDLIEWDKQVNNNKRPGLFFALWGTTTKLAFALAIGIAFPLLDILGFSANDVNDDQAITALAWLYGLPCIGFKLLALFFMKNYPITEKKYSELIKQKKDVNLEV